MSARARGCGLPQNPAIDLQRRLRAVLSGAPAPYSTTAARRGSVSMGVTGNGTLQPTRAVNIGSELSGTVARVLVDINDPVRRGQVLVQLDTARLEDQIVRSRAALAAARAGMAQGDATLDEARSALARLQEVARLSGGQVPSQAELDTGRAALARAEAGWLSAVASVQSAQRRCRATVPTGARGDPLAHRRHCP